MAYYFDDPIEEVEPARRNPLGIFGLIVALVVGGFFVKSTLAANINLNLSQAVEFGQGIQQLAACSGGTAITLTPVSTFSNASGAGAFMFKSVTISNIPSSCYGNDFQINAFDSTTSTALSLFNSSAANAVVFNNYGNYSAASGASGITVTKNSSTSVTLSFDTPVATAASVSKLTIQSALHTYSIGETGPGGGMIFYVNASGFNEVGAACAPNCRYLEAAPYNWSGQGHLVTPWAVSAYQSTTVPAYNGYAATGTSIGTGLTNTQAIVNQNGAYNFGSNRYAAGATVAYNGGGKTDWFLPSKDELTAVNSQRSMLYGANIIVYDYYYGSTEISSTQGLLTTMSGASSGNGGFTKSGGGTSYVLAIRAF